MSEDGSLLVLGYGNPGRQDDGLGPACANYIEALELKNVDVHIGYQLAVEDALLMQQAGRVLFVDAALELPGPYQLSPVRAAPQASFGTHTLSPGALLYLAESIFDVHVEAYVFAIRGYEFDRFEERLSAQAREGFKTSCDFLLQQLSHWGYIDSGRGRTAPPRDAQDNRQKTRCTN